MYMHAWKKGLKTTYYLRSRPATKIAKATVANASTRAGSATSNALSSSSAEAPSKDAAAIACSLENPGTCEACQ
jgi:ribonucleoside-diphosphate reductase alpha chain